MRGKNLVSCVCLPLLLGLVFVAESPVCHGAESSHVLFLIGEDEYKTEVTLPRFAQTELEPRGVRCTVVHADASNPNSFPGVEALRSADLLFLSVRRRAPRAEQLEVVRQFLNGGKPLVGIRTACHAFHTRGKRDDGHAEWQAFDPEVLGGNYTGHHPNGPETTITLAPNAGEHAILKGVSVDGWKSKGSLYKVSPLAKTTSTLLIGKIDNQPAEPIVWTNTYRGGRVFYTSLGHVDDFSNTNFNTLLVNAVFWALDKPVSSKGQR